MPERELGSYKRHHEAIREEYKKQAPHWAKRQTSPHHLQWVVDHLNLRPHLEVLDVASGTGLLARTIAPYVNKVVASDITSEMQSLGSEEADLEGLTNVFFEQGAAEGLPYPDLSFDMVVTRFSVHHFVQPQAVVAEMARVCRPGGEVAVIDMTSPEDEGLAARYNTLERMRDSTHTRALSARELNRLVAEAGLQITARHSREVEMNARRWLDTAQVRPPERTQILTAIDEELEGSRVTGLRPFLSDSELMLTHLWEMIVAQKPAA